MNLKNVSVSVFFVTLVAAGMVISCKKDNSPTTLPTSNVNLKKGLLLYLPFDGNMADSSGNGNITNPLAGGSLTYDEHGVGASAFGADGSGARLQVTSNGSIKYDTAFSFAYQFMTRTTDQQVLLTMVDPSSGKGPAFVTGPGENGVPNFSYSTVPYSTGCNYGSATGTEIVAPFVAQTEAWYNVIGTYEKGKMQLFINGKLIATQTGPAEALNQCANAKVIVGGWWDQDPQGLNGKIDEVRLYNRVLNADEIAELSKDFNH